MKFIILSITFHVVASICLKSGALYLRDFTILSIMTNFLYLTSLFFLFLQALTWQYALKKFNLGYAYMFTSLYYPIILLASLFLFNETVTFGNIAGTFIIITGLSLAK